MAALSRLKQLARLFGWLWLSLMAMMLAACGAMFASACKHTTRGDKKDAGPDAAPALAPDARVLAQPDTVPAREAAAPVDVNRDELWNVPCE